MPDSVRESCINKEVLDALKKLLNFAEELCEDINISKHYPSMEKARQVITKYEAIDACIAEIRREK